jgi:hypothetical protein
MKRICIAAAAAAIAFAPFSAVVMPGVAHAWTCNDMKLPQHSIDQCNAMPPNAQQGLLNTICDYQHHCG